MRSKIKEKIGYYKTLITLLWTSFIILSGGAYKVYQLQQFLLFQLSIFGILALVILIGCLMVRIKYWINKLED